MPQATVPIINALGLHLRASSKLSQLATRFPCEVWLTRGTKKVNAKSVLGVTMWSVATMLTLGLFAFVSTHYLRFFADGQSLAAKREPAPGETDSVLLPGACLL